MDTYKYIHIAGYGRDDHMANEIIARAARRLGADAGRYITAAVGLASHAVPMGSVQVSLPAKSGVRRRMEDALRSARKEVLRRDCRIDVTRVRWELRRHAGRWVRVESHHRDGRWTVIGSIPVEEAEG